MKTYKPGTLVEYDGFEIEELLVIIGKNGHSLQDGPLYDVYNFSFNMFMQRSQKFLDKYYSIVIE